MLLGVARVVVRALPEPSMDIMEPTYFLYAGRPFLEAARRALGRDVPPRRGEAAEAEVSTPRRGGEAAAPEVSTPPRRGEAPGPETTPDHDDDDDDDAVVTRPSRSE